MAAGPIEDYVRTLDRLLVGPGRAKRDMLAEARDSLVDAAEAYQAAGVDRQGAERRAVAEFGAPSRIAPEYQRELAAGAARRLALLVAAVAAGGILVGDRMWQGAPWAQRTPSPGYQLAAGAVDYLHPVLTAAAVAFLLGLRWLARRDGDPRRLCRTLGLAMIGMLGLAAALTVTLFVWTVVTVPQAVTWPPMAVGGVLVAALTAWQIVVAVRCLRCSLAAWGPRVRPASLAPGPGTC